MSAPDTRTPSQAELDAAHLLLARMGISPGDLFTAAVAKPPAPTFAAYIPVVAQAVSPGTRRVYGSYWNRLLEHWGSGASTSLARRILNDWPSTSRPMWFLGGTRAVGAAEHLIAALRCVYRHAIADGLITEGENPARKVAKPRRLPSTRQAVPDGRLAEINQVAASTGNDPGLDSLLLRLHTDTACRRGGALALRPADIDSDQCLLFLREKGGTVSWQPISPT